MCEWKILHNEVCRQRKDMGKLMLIHVESSEEAEYTEEMCG